MLFKYCHYRIQSVSVYLHGIFQTKHLHYTTSGCKTRWKYMLRYCSIPFTQDNINWMQRICPLLSTLCMIWNTAIKKQTITVMVSSWVSSAESCIDIENHWKAKHFNMCYLSCIMIQPHDLKAAQSLWLIYICVR